MDQVPISFLPGKHPSAYCEGPRAVSEGFPGGPGRTEGVSPSLLIHLRLALAQTDPQEQRRLGSEIKQLLSGAKGPPTSRLEGSAGGTPGTPPHPAASAPAGPPPPQTCHRNQLLQPDVPALRPDVRRAARPAPPCPVRGVGLSPGALQRSWGVGCIFVGCRSWGCFVVCLFWLNHHASWREAQGLPSLHPKTR